MYGRGLCAFVYCSRTGPGSKRQRVAFWQLALAASALILLGLNVGAVFNSNFPANSDNGDEVSTMSGSGSSSSGRRCLFSLLCLPLLLVSCLWKNDIY